MIYFAYGSNMLTERLQTRVPSAEPQGRARLPGMSLRFHKRSVDDSAKASLSPARDGGAAWGVCFTMNADDVEALDAAEGRSYGYARRTISVQQGQEKVDALVYTARSAYIDASLVPYEWYRALVVAGALEHDLPDPYVSLLRSVPTTPDPDDARREKNVAILHRAGYEHVMDER